MGGRGQIRPRDLRYSLAELHKQQHLRASSSSFHIGRRHHCREQHAHVWLRCLRRRRPGANNFNLCGAEFYVGTTNNSAILTRSGINLNSIGSAKGGLSDDSQPWFDAGLIFTGGPQVASVQQSGKAGWLCGVAVSSHYGDQTVGICEPINSDGYMIGAFGTWACKGVLYASEITTSGPAIDLPVSTNGTGGVRFGKDASIFRDRRAAFASPRRSVSGVHKRIPEGLVQFAYMKGVPEYNQSSTSEFHDLLLQIADSGMASMETEANTVVSQSFTQCVCRIVDLPAS